MKNIGYKKASLEKVEKEIYQKRRTVRYDIRDLTVEAIGNKYDDSLDDEASEKKKYNCIYIPEYQRDFTWEPDRQSKLIESIILGLPIPFIFVAENKDSSWEIVDGSQRIRTIHAFLNNELKLEGLKSIELLNGYKFEELDESRQGKILNTALRIIVLSEETTDDVKIDMFERINRGSDLLKPMEKRKGIFIGPFNSFIYDYCKENEKYTNLIQVDKWLAKRQELEELLLRFFAISDNQIYEKGIEIGISNYLDEYLDKKNKEIKTLTPEQQTAELNKYKQRIDAVVDFVDKYFPYGFRHKKNPQTKRSVFEAISVGVWLAISRKVNPTTLDSCYIKRQLDSSEFKQYTHVANQLHKKQKLKGRIEFIYNMIKSTEE
ncbi:MAG: DUF262 domain-containing protein [Sporomusaceae bacterium]|nr:DUF262 domain-containing protein [Sporomusaceae bacterium]